MAQNSVNYGNNPTGPELLDDYLDKEQENILTSNSGIQRPSYADVGTKWLDISSTPWALKIFDGTSDVIIGTVNPTTHAFISAGIDTAVLLTGNQTIGGTKTFTVSPQVPTVSSGDSSSNVANTAFVTTVSSNLQTQINQKANSSDVVNLTESQTITVAKTFTNKVEIQGANGHILFHIPGTMYTRLQESSNGLEVRSGDGANLAPLFAAWSDANNSVVVTAAKSKASNGYFKLGNGMIAQWGYVGSSGTVSFPTPFSTTNFGVVFTRTSANGTNDNDAISSKTATSFNVTIYQGGGGHWIAIGY